jgi:hypothetical protein
LAEMERGRENFDEGVTMTHISLEGVYVIPLQILPAEGLHITGVRVDGNGNWPTKDIFFDIQVKKGEEIFKPGITWEIMSKEEWEKRKGGDPL